MRTPSKKSGATPRRPGRPPLEEGAETVIAPIRMTPAQREKLGRLGGAKWVRKKIDQAKEPAAE